MGTFCVCGIDVAEVSIPEDYHTRHDLWTGNRIADASPWVGDLAMVVKNPSEKNAQKLRMPTPTSNPEFPQRRASIEVVDEYMALHNSATKEDVVFAGVWPTKNPLIKIAGFVSRTHRKVVNARRLKILMGCISFDKVLSGKGNCATSPLLFFDADELVGVLLPLNIAHSIVSYALEDLDIPGPEAFDRLLEVRKVT